MRAGLAPSILTQPVDLNYYVSTCLFTLIIFNSNLKNDLRYCKNKVSLSYGVHIYRLHYVFSHAKKEQVVELL